MASQDAEAKVEAALEVAGNGTFWMWRLFLATSICGVFNMWLLLSWVFLAQEVPFHCNISALDKAGFTGEQQAEITDWNEVTCELSDLDYKALSNETFEEALKKAGAERAAAGTRPCDSVVFSEVGTSCVEELRLVCERHMLLPTLQTVVPAGKLVGSLSMGWLSDGVGRRKGFIISSALCMFSAAIPFLARDYIGLCIGRFMMGIGGTGCFYSGLTLSVEVASEKWRGILGVLFNFSYAIGMMTLPLLSYFIPQWRNLLLAVSVPVYLLFISIWVITESPRWLVTKGKYAQAWKILKKADERVDEILGEPPPDEEKSTGKVTCQDVKAKILRTLQLISNFCVHYEMILRLLAMVCVWFFVNLNYYALPLSAKSFGVNSYIMIVLTGVMEAIGYSLPIVLLKWFPRRPIGCGLFVIAGSALLVTMIIPRGTPWSEGVLLAYIMFIRVTNSMAFALIIVFTAELFPTEQRATALGICSATSHVAGMISSYIVDADKLYDYKLFVPLCAAATLMIAIIILLPPETKGKQFLETIEELEEKAKEGQKISFRNLARCNWN